MEYSEYALVILLSSLWAIDQGESVFVSWNSSVNKVTSYSLDDRTSVFDTGRIVSHHHIQTNSGTTQPHIQWIE